MAEDQTLDPNLSPKQLRALEALLTSGNVAQAARAAEVTRDTLYRWMKEPAFAKALRESEGIALDALTRSLRGLGDKAVTALAAVFDDETAPHAVKIRAARVVLASHPQYLQSVVLAERVEAIEAALEESR